MCIASVVHTCTPVRWLEKHLIECRVCSYGVIYAFATEPSMRAIDHLRSPVDDFITPRRLVAPSQPFGQYQPVPRDSGREPKFSGYLTDIPSAQGCRLNWPQWSKEDALERSNNCKCRRMSKNARSIIYKAFTACTMEQKARTHF